MALSTVSFDLPNHPLAAGLCRGAIRTVGESLPGEDGDLLDLLDLLTNELVTNSIIHAPDSPRVFVVISIFEDRVRVEVTDLDEDGSPTLEPHSLTRTSGRGLYLVDELSHRWGVEQRDGTRVWFELLHDHTAAV
jgi:hypothetical protein